MYVDDVKLAGPIKNMGKGWKLIATDLELDPPQPLSLYLGCIHERSEVKKKSASIQIMTYKMEDFLRLSVELYVERFPSAPPMTAASSVRVATPCMSESHEQAPAAIPASSTCDVSGGVEPADAEESGGVDPAVSAAKKFHTAAARVIMEVMYAARMARRDLLRSIA